MAKPKIDKQTSVKSILKDLKKGIDKNAILSKVVKSCQISERTAMRYYDEAEKQFLEFRAKVEPILVAKTAEHELEIELPSNEIMLKHLANLAMTAEYEKDKIAATVNYLKARGGFVPKELDVTISSLPIFGDNPLDAKQ